MSRQAFDQAVTFFVDTVSRIPADQWDAPGLGVWDVRSLVGHTTRALLTVEQYAAVGADRVGFGTAGDIAERGRAAGQALGDDPAAAVREIAERVVSLVASLPDDHPLKTPAGELPLTSYLPSRVLELTLHAMDLAGAIGATVEPPIECMRAALYALSDSALRGGVGRDVAFALTGRKPLADGFSLLP